MKKIRESQNKNSIMDSLDRASEHCLNIMALAELLEGCHAELEPHIIVRAGHLLSEENRQLHEELQNCQRMEESSQ